MKILIAKTIFFSIFCLQTTSGRFQTLFYWLRKKMLCVKIFIAKQLLYSNLLSSNNVRTLINTSYWHLKKLICVTILITKTTFSFNLVSSNNILTIPNNTYWLLQEIALCILFPATSIFYSNLSFSNNARTIPNASYWHLQEIAVYQIPYPFQMFWRQQTSGQLQTRPRCSSEKSLCQNPQREINMFVIFFFSKERFQKNPNISYWLFQKFLCATILILK